MTSKYHNHKLQTNPWYHEEVTQDIRDQPMVPRGSDTDSYLAAKNRKVIQGCQLSLPRQGDWTPRTASQNRDPIEKKNNSTYQCNGTNSKQLIYKENQRPRTDSSRRNSFNN